MVYLTCDVVWVKDLLSEHYFTLKSPMRLYCDNQAIIHIAKILVFYECTKHIEIDYYLIYSSVSRYTHKVS